MCTVVLKGQSLIRMSLYDSQLGIERLFEFEKASVTL